MVKIAINNKNLHNIQMRLNTEKGISLLSYPENRIIFEENNEKFILKIPAFLVIELYRLKILSQEKSHSFSIRLQNKELGIFQMTNLKYPSSWSSELIEIELKKINSKKKVYK